MARFELKKVAIRRVGMQYDANGNAVGQINTSIQNAGKEYLYGMLQNKDCVFEQPVTYVSFNEMVVEFLKTLLPVNKGGSAAVEAPLPEAYSNIQGEFVEVMSPVPFYKKHLTAFPAKGTRPAIQIGEIVKDYDQNGAGVPRVYTKLVVFCQYYISSDLGEKQYVKGSTPEEQFQQQWKNLCVPVKTHTADATNTIASSAPIAGDIPVVM